MVNEVYNEERYSKLVVGSSVHINVAHFMNWTNLHGAKHCHCEYGEDYEYDENTDCCYLSHELYNENDEFVCASAIEYPDCWMKVVEVDADKVVLVRGDKENDSRVTLTKEELFVAASRFDGFDWVITF